MNQSWPWLSPLSTISRQVMITPYQGALTQLYAATSLEVEEKDLKYVFVESLVEKDPYKQISEGLLTLYLLARWGQSRVWAKIKTGS